MPHPSLLLTATLLLLQVAYGSADVLDPTYTYSVTWQPADGPAASAARLTAADADTSKMLPPLPANCIWYKVGCWQVV
jgi:hypothetical protein